MPESGGNPEERALLGHHVKMVSSLDESIPAVPVGAAPTPSQVMRADAINSRALQTCY
jgi:hypothetical protein